MENKLIPDAERDAIFAELKKLPENDKCFDCGKRNPKWASISLGLYLCIDCSGKHREYGVRYTFVRSITLDSWSRKQIMHMQLGGNQQARLYFEEVGLLSASQKTMEYKNTHVEKYKANQTKKVEEALSESSAVEVKPVVVPLVPEVVEAPKEKFQCNLESEVKVIQPKTSIVFQNTKTTEPVNKGKVVQGKKIQNIDFDSLMFDDPFSSSETTVKSDPFSSNSIPAPKPEEKKVIVKETKIAQPTPVDTQTQDQLDKFREKNVKSISSASLFQNENSEQDRQNIYKFQGSQAISSKQFFGEQEQEDSGADSGQRLENVKQFFSFAGGKAKDTLGNLSTSAGGYLSSLKQKFGQQQS